MTTPDAEPPLVALPVRHGDEPSAVATRVPGPASGPALTVDLGAVTANARTLLTTRGSGALMAVVKADGFGHGAVDVARAAVAGGASWLGVTSVPEALVLRADGLDLPLLSWLNPVDADFAAAVEAEVDLAVPGPEHLAALTRAVRLVRGRRPTGPARVHLHVDCGMARDGCPPSTWRRLVHRAALAESRGLVDVVGVMGHLGCAEDASDPHNGLGVAQFTRAVALARSAGLRPRVRHLAATAATLTTPASRFDLSRVGAGLVGIDPTRTTRLRPAMTLTAPVVGVHRVTAGTPVGYGHTHVTGRRTTLGLLPVGYADGVPRGLSQAAEVQLGRRRCPVVGRVSMDQIVVDLGADAGVRVGDVAVLFGPGDRGEPTVADWARWAGTIENEIVTGIGSRVSRRVVGDVPEAPRRLVRVPAGCGS